MAKADTKETMSFLSELPEKEMKDLRLQVVSFVVKHATHHRPIALVSSGGTVADLEVHSVRCLDNFSTGLRGAISVEEFLRRGYAVIHLWRRGSAAPYARAISQYLGLQQANHALDCDCLGKLFAVEGEDHDEELVKTVLEEERDPWLTNPSSSDSIPARESSRSDADEIALNRGLVYSTRVHKALRERSVVLQEDRLLTVPFRSVEDYLGRLQLCSESLRDCQSLAVFFLAAAVSDFYVPRSERVQHKIQSGGGDGLTLKLRPVPKAIGPLREEWAPDAFVVTFKLETDKQILRQKAERAVDRYGCHMVIGNILESRHDKVWILTPEDQRAKNPESAKDWPLVETTRPNADKDSLEGAIMDFVIQSHFEYISWNYQADGSGVVAAERSHRLLKEKKQKLQRELFLRNVKNVGMEVAAGVAALLISYAINAAMQNRLQRR